MNLADLQISHHGPRVVASVVGEIDMSNAHRIGDAVVGAMQNQALALVLDLSRVSYLDSSGIQLIYQLRERLQARGQQLKLVIPSGSPTTDALRLAGISGAIDSTETVDEALTATAEE